MPADLRDQTKQWFEASRRGNDLWIVGLGGKLLRFDGKTWTGPASGTDRTLLTVNCTATTCAAVGGDNSGQVLELQSDLVSWKTVTPGKPMPLNGVAVRADGSGYAVGAAAQVLVRKQGAWQIDDNAATQLDKLEAWQDFHGVHIDSEGGVWAVGGQLMSNPTRDGQVAYFGARKIPTSL